MDCERQNDCWKSLFCFWEKKFFEELKTQKFYNSVFGESDRRQKMEILTTLYSNNKTELTSEKGLKLIFCKI